MIEIVEIARQRLDGKIGMFSEKEGLAKNFLGTSPDIIYLAEQRLNLSLPKDYIKFVEDYGNLIIGSRWIYGITDDNFESLMISDGFRATIDARKNFNFPINYYIIADEEGDEFHCIDCSTESGVVLAWETHSELPRGELSKNFSDYLAFIIMKSLPNSN
jgi:hypothetical protein